MAKSKGAARAVHGIPKTTREDRKGIKEERAGETKVGIVIVEG